MSDNIQIGPLRIPAPVMLAPMAGYTDFPFRESVRSITAMPFLAFSEMVEPHSILRGGGKKRDALLLTTPEDIPLAWQIYGTDPALMAESARWLVNERGAVMIDINMGCPKRKIARRGAGAGLLIDCDLAVKIAQQVAAAVPVPVTAKLRLGWEMDDEIALELAPKLEAIGIAALTVHGRAGVQGYSGEVNSHAITRIVNAVDNIPVIANGDITSADKALEMQRQTGCAAVMIGRAALYNPWLIQNCIMAFAGKTPSPPPDLTAQHDFMRQHFYAIAKVHDLDIAILLFRRWIPQYAKMLRIPRPVMVQLLQTRTLKELRESLDVLGVKI